MNNATVFNCLSNLTEMLPQAIGLPLCRGLQIRVMEVERSLIIRKA